MQSEDYRNEITLVVAELFLSKVLWNKKNVVPLQRRLTELLFFVVLRSRKWTVVNEQSQFNAHVDLK